MIYFIKLRFYDANMVCFFERLGTILIKYTHICYETWKYGLRL